ncbi:MAG: xanthine dehydrogenase family protein molybdopterin-binding subunit [Acidimicrobiaceae bacterium]|nr:xanthine dehydrogenase family protein molybdopterin-binding subunit [Acidimicrobiaceae bacterium]
MSTRREPLIGTSARRPKNRELLAGKGIYVGDIRLAGQVHARMVRSTSAHARLIGVDASEALRLAGVLGVFTAADIPDVRIPIRIPFAVSPEANAALQAPLASGVVRYVGEPVAVVVADDPYVAEDAAELVVVDLDELEPVVSIAAAGGPQQPRVHESLESNTLNRQLFIHGDVDGAFAEADIVVQRRMRVHRVTAAPIETRGLVADYDAESGTLTVWGGAKVKHFTRDFVAEALAMASDDVRVVEVEVGGGFGIRGEPYPEDVVVAWLARRLRRPVAWVEDRAEHLVATNHSREQHHDFELAARADGRMLAFRVRGVCDHGAYVRTQGLLPVMLPMLHLPGPYAWQAFRMDLESVMTNRTPVGSYRGPGMTEATFVRERMVDIAAAELGMDPADLRRRNLIGAESMPHTFMPGPGSSAAMPISYQGGDFVAAFDELLEGAGYIEMRAQQRRERVRGRNVGVGVAAYIEFAAVGPFEDVEVVCGDSGVTIRAGVGSLGQGVETALAQIAAELLDVALGDVSVEFHDTASVPQGFGAFASRSTVLAGNAIAAAVEEFRAEAARRLACGHDEVEIIDGAAVGPGGASVPLARVGAVRGRFAMEGLTASFGGAVCTASADPADGRIRVQDFALAHDVGRAVNPRLLRGQLSGAAAQGIGGALFEELAYDENGQPLSVTLADYMMPTASDLPETKVTIIEHGSKSNPLGIKGGGEAGMVGSFGAVANAVADAVGDEAEIVDSSLSPARVWHALHRPTGQAPGEA